MACQKDSEKVCLTVKVMGYQMVPMMVDQMVPRKAGQKAAPMVDQKDLSMARLKV